MKKIIATAIGVLASAFLSTASQAAFNSFTVTAVTLSTSTGVLTLTGTVQCTSGDSLQVGAVVVQMTSKQVGLGGNASGPTRVCTGGTDTWTITETVLFGSMQKGKAGVIAQGYDQTDYKSSTVFDAQTQITLVP